VARLCIPITPGGEVDSGWGRAQYVAVAELDPTGVLDWHEHHVRWGEAHEASAEGSHHALIARFLREHGVSIVLAGHMGPPMQHILEKMGVTVRLCISGDARVAARAVLLD
jgi:predicted Fe-Mo cluster-binding NifX family protein